MSRSYKKTPIIQFAPESKKSAHVKWAKRQANKKVRKSVCSDGKSYKILYCSYNIHDCKGYVHNTKYLRK